MKIRNAHLAASAAIALALSSGVASAQQPAAPAAAPPSPLTGPPIPGLCVFSRDAAIGGSRLGRYIVQRVQTLDQQAGAELKSTRDSLVNDANAVKTQATTLTQAQIEQKQLELDQRNRGLQQLAERRQQELQITENKALDRFATEVNPLLELTVREKNCSLVLNDAGIYGVSPAMDMTASVIQKLDAKITEITFDRANLDQEIAAMQAAQGGRPGTGPAAAPRPATQPARPTTPRR